MSASRSGSQLSTDRNIDRNVFHLQYNYVLGTLVTHFCKGNIK